MAKTKNNLIRISGKLSGKVFVENKKYGSYVREAPEEGSRKDEPQLKENYRRTRVLNGVASEVNTVIKQQAGIIRDKQLYHEMLSRFRKAKDAGTNRFLLLLELRDLEVNHYCQIAGLQNIGVVANAKNIVVSLDVLGHPDTGKHETDCYRYQLTLLCWNKTKRKARVAMQKSAWCYIKDGKGEFDFPFPKPAGMTHWLLLMRLRMGMNGKTIDVSKSDGMQVAEVGTVDKKEIALWRKRDKQRKAEWVAQTKKQEPDEDDDEGVKPKRMRK
jgi:hypothetical protein